MEETIISLQAPVSGPRIERWVEEQVALLRADARAIGVRLGPLWRAWRAQTDDWLIEVDRRDRDVPLEEDIALTSILLDMQLLGLRPQLVVNPHSESPEIAGSYAMVHVPREGD